MEIAFGILLWVIIGLLWRIADTLKSIKLDIEYYAQKKYGLFSRKTYEKIERDFK